jgi:hypothetical protein
MEYVYDIYLLSSDFINNYPLSDYPELMYKQSRPYNCLLIDTHDDYFICIPFRTSINHKNAYHFKNSKRSRKSKSGLDYSKIVIIKESSYISSSKAIIDHDEYIETMQNINRITLEALNYVDKYILHIKGLSILHDKEFNRLYRFSTLKYFHKELGIN